MDPQGTVAGASKPVLSRSKYSAEALSIISFHSAKSTPRIHNRLTLVLHDSMTVHLGPVSPAITPAPPKNPRTDGYGDNPRCHRRDISNYLSSRYSRTVDIVNLISQSKDISTFQNAMQGASTANPVGVHSAGHFTIAGDPGGDFYTSPNDPAFWVHHGMIDRTWSIWQTQNLTSRTTVIAGGTSMMGFGSKLQSLDDVVDLGVVGPGMKTYKIRDLTSTVDGPFCYTYE